MVDDKKYSVCRIFIASPSDVKAERQIVEEVILEWDATHSEDKQCILLPVRYERDAYSSTGNHPQSIINHQCLDKCDFLVGIFWSRIGAPTKKYPSGTIEEISEHCKTGKPAMIYFCNRPASIPIDFNCEQLSSQVKKVLEYKEKIKNDVFYKEYLTITDFKNIFKDDLEKLVLTHIQKTVQFQRPSLPEPTVLSVPTAVKEEKASFGDGSYAGEQKPLTIRGKVYIFCWCPKGEFWMGSPEGEKGRYDKETRHYVRLSHGFWMLETPVTQRLWKDIIGKNPSEFKFKGANRPVECVSWDDCQAFINKLNQEELLRGYKAILPSEAQWEYACRAGTDTPFSFGSALNGDKANCDGRYPYGTEKRGNYLAKTTVVKSYSPNNWNLYDMHGNVLEWCSDRYGAYPKEAVTDPTGPNSGSSRVYRGGSWFSYAGYCRSAHRFRNDPTSRFYNLGFRLALVPSK